MKLSKKHLFGLSALAAIMLIAIILMQKNEPGKYDDFAKCLTDSGVKMYGAYWCPHCLNQKKAFGNSWKYVDYIECSLPNAAGQTQECNKAGIEGYPTWEFSDSSRLEGEVSFEGLSVKSGCAL
jgi:hypothetical protein